MIRTTFFETLSDCTRSKKTHSIVTRSVSEGLHDILLTCFLAYASGYNDRNCATSNLTLRVTIRVNRVQNTNSESGTVRKVQFEPENCEVTTLTLLRTGHDCFSRYCQIQSFKDAIDRKTGFVEERSSTKTAHLRQDKQILTPE